jgi:hypothetical protein
MIIQYCKGEYKNILEKKRQQGWEKQNSKQKNQKTV